MVAEVTTSSKKGTDIRGVFVRYLLVGVFNSILDLTLFTVLTVGLSWNEVISNVISTSLTIFVSYSINRSFVFRSRQRTWGTALGFVSVTLFSAWILQSAVVWGVIGVGGLIGLNNEWSILIVPLAKTFAMGAGALFNFVGYRVVFSKDLDVSTPAS